MPNSFFIQIILRQPTKVPNQANAVDAVNCAADLRRYLHGRIKYAKNVLDKYALMMHILLHIFGGVDHENNLEH